MNRNPEPQRRSSESQALPGWFTPAAALCFLMFVASPFLIARAPYEATMGMVQKIFYYHVPAAITFFAAAFACGIASWRYLFGGRARADRVAAAAGELAVIFGAIVLVTGPLWARKSWGVWWQWDVRLTSSLLMWMTFVAYLLVRRYGGPGAEKLAAGLALFGMANVPFVYVSVNVWRTIHPPTTVVPTLPASMGGPFWFCLAAFLLLFAVLLQLRVKLEDQRSRVDALYLAIGDR